jgi:heptaprenyl diphosphate synthase
MSAPAGSNCPPSSRDIALLAGAPANATLEAASAYALEAEGGALRSTLLVRASAFGTGKADDSVVRRAAAAVELLHLATLVRDDVAHDARVRRGRPTVGAQFGIRAAALTATWLFSRALGLMTGCGDRTWRAFAEVADTVCAAQMLEVEDLFDCTRTPGRCRLAMRARTASLFGFAAGAGADLAGASAQTVASLDRCGRAFGMAVQLADDLRGLLGGDAATGPAPGSDLRNGVYTLPVIFAIESDAGLARLLRSDLSGDAAEEAVARVRATGAVARARAEMMWNVAEAGSALARAGGTEDARRGVREVIDEALSGQWEEDRHAGFIAAGR